MSGPTLRPFSAFTRSILLLALIAFSCWFFLNKMTPQDEKTYDSLMGVPLSSDNKNTEPYTAFQEHQRASKEIRFTKQGELLHAKIYSDSSHLQLHYYNHHTSLVEEMERVTCAFQEELFYLLPDGRQVKKMSDHSWILREDTSAINASECVEATPVQLVRYIEADRATYFYQEQQLKGEGVHVYQYLIPGHQLELPLPQIAPLMSGLAKSLELSLDEDDFSLTAYGFTGLINHENPS